MSSFTSVVSVNVTKDLKYAKIYVSVMGTQEEKEDTLKALKSATGYIKKEIATRLNLRIVPQPNFVLDNSIDYGMHINDLIHKINGDN
jgi:ribosome-binding factor A